MRFFNGADELTNNQGGGAGLASALDPHIRQASKRWNVDLNYNAQLTPHFKLTTQAAYFNTSQEVKNQYTIFPAGAFNGAFPNGFIGNPEVWERHTRINATALYSGIEKHTLRLGVGYHHSDMYKIKETKNFECDENMCLESWPLNIQTMYYFMFFKFCK